MTRGSFDNLRPASFRGVAFAMETAEKEFGPRVVTHEFARRVDPAHEFNGAIPQQFTVDAIIFADDLDTASRALDAALLEEASGPLVHPVYGELEVVVIPPVRSRYSTYEGRVLRYTITFQRYGALASPTVQVDTAGSVRRSASAARLALVQDFASSYAVANQHAFVMTQAQDVLHAVLNTTLSQLGIAAPASFLASAKAASAKVFAIPYLAAISPQELGGAVLDVLTTPPTTAAAQPLMRMADTVVLPEPVRVTNQMPSQVRSNDNTRALVQLVRSGAAVEAMRQATAEGWSSREQAESWRDDAAETLALRADVAADLSQDMSWRSLVDLRAQVARDVSVRALPLPRLREFTPLQSEPAALVAYRLDGDALATIFERGADIVSRNAVRHPGFVPGGKKLEVLSRG